MEDKPVQPLISAGSPRRARLPIHRALRWVADGEDGRAPGIRVFVTQPAFRAINAHANSDLDNEVGGWLAGRWCRDIDTKAEFVVVEALLPAQQVRSGSTFLTFTHDSQVAMLAALEERYATKGIVGWCHTHPRMGLFLSGYDTWLHEHFFPYHWQVALVVDPHGHQGGFFIRNGQKDLDARRYYGFYELLNRRGESNVDWNNLRAEKNPEPHPEAPKPVASKSTPVPEAAKPTGRTSPARQSKAEVKAAEAVIVADKAAEVKPEPAKRAQVKMGDTQPVQVKRVQAAKAPPTRVETGSGVLKKFEGPKPPAKVNLQNKPNKSNHEGEPSEETKP
ncbi:MAG: Mov34/MPN/PAD-1 family protein [Anaerolineales bacterium]